MKTVDNVLIKIERFPNGYVFTYEDFMNEVNGREAVIKALNRLAAAGRIAKLSKGKFYKAESTPFGILEPDRYQVVKDLLEKDGRIVGYLTGLSIYNQLGLSTQVSNVIQIGKDEVRPKFKRGNYTISFVRQKNIITKDSIPLLQVLDAMRYIKKIPDTTVLDAVGRIRSIISNLDNNQRSSMVRLAKKYPPAARALLGAILCNLTKEDIAKPLMVSLNPISTYPFKGLTTLLPEATKWNII
jgi:hypothetical protein